MNIEEMRLWVGATNTTLQKLLALYSGGDLPRSYHHIYYVQDEGTEGYIRLKAVERVHSLTNGALYIDGHLENYVWEGGQWALYTEGYAEGWGFRLGAPRSPLPLVNHKGLI